MQCGKDKFNVMDKRDLCNYHKASQFREVADIAYLQFIQVIVMVCIEAFGKSTLRYIMVD